MNSEARIAKNAKPKITYLPSDLHDLDAQFLDLLFRNGRGSSQEQIFALLILREGDHFADIRLLGIQHGHAVETPGDASVGRGAKFKRAKHVAETPLGILIRDLEDIEDTFLEIAFVDTHGATADFVSVEDDVVRFGFHL